MLLAPACSSDEGAVLRGSTTSCDEARCWWCLSCSAGAAGAPVAAATAAARMADAVLAASGLASDGSDLMRLAEGMPAGIHHTACHISCLIICAVHQLFMCMAKLVNMHIVHHAKGTDSYG